MIVRVHELDDTKLSQVLDALQNLGVNVTTGEESVEESELFYTARINSKLDNLGQLRHLFKSAEQIRSLSDLLKPFGNYFSDLLREREHRQLAARRYYNRMSAAYSTTPVSDTPIEYLSHQEIFALFEPKPRS